MSRATPLLLVVGIAVMPGCKSSDTTNEASSMQPRYVELAKARYGENVEFIDNGVGNFVLVVSKAKPSQMAPHPEVSFFVYGKEESDVTYESEVVGSVTWLDDYHLEVVIVPGIVKAGSEPGGVTYRIDVRTGSRVEVTPPARHR